MVRLLGVVGFQAVALLGCLCRRFHRSRVSQHASWQHSVSPLSYCCAVQERMKKNDVRYRFVIDIQGSLIAG